MWSLQNLLLTTCVALRCVTGAGGVVHVTGYLGRKVSVSCSYDEGYETYEKYLCKNDCGDEDILITTSDSVKNKYMIRDDKWARIFTTTINYLRSTDGGKYWCGVSRTGKDIYTEVELKLVQDSCCDTVTRIQSYEGYSETISCTYESQYQNNLKYICRGNRPSTCLQQALVTSDTKQNGRFRLDDGNILRIFTVTIRSLSLKDSGRYLCGVQRNSDLDVFSAVELEVKEWCCVKSKEISGTVGHPLTLQCPYPPQHGDNRKFLCKGDHRHNCVDMAMSHSRFVLRDDVSSSSFSVRITELEAADAGTYWCGSDSQWRVGNYIKIVLSVVLPKHTSTVPSTIETLGVTVSSPVETLGLTVPSTIETLGQTVPSPVETPGLTVPSPAETLGQTPTQIPDGGLYALYAVPPVLLLLICVLVVVVYKCKHYKVKGDEAVRNRNAPKEEDIAEVISPAGSDIYGNQEVVTYTQKRPFKQQSAYNDYGDAVEDEPDYENFATEEIYGNESFHKAY